MNGRAYPGAKRGGTAAPRTERLTYMSEQDNDPDIVVSGIDLDGDGELDLSLIHI